MVTKSFSIGWLPEVTHRSLMHRSRWQLTTQCASMSSTGRNEVTLLCSGRLGTLGASTRIRSRMPLRELANGCGSRDREHRSLLRTLARREGARCMTSHSLESTCSAALSIDLRINVARQGTHGCQVVALENRSVVARRSHGSDCRTMGAWMGTFMSHVKRGLLCSNRIGRQSG
ncbi:hypothetical protein MRX96_022360 [Rhipicephalus microplus]